MNLKKAGTPSDSDRDFRTPTTPNSMKTPVNRKKLLPVSPLNSPRNALCERETQTEKIVE